MREPPQVRGTGTLLISMVVLQRASFSSRTEAGSEPAQNQKRIWKSGSKFAERGQTAGYTVRRRRGGLGGGGGGVGGWGGWNRTSAGTAVPARHQPAPPKMATPSEQIHFITSKNPPLDNWNEQGAPPATRARISHAQTLCSSHLRFKGVHDRGTPRFQLKVPINPGHRHPPPPLAPPCPPASPPPRGPASKLADATAARPPPRL
jgi:hypothetical protein